MEHLEQKARGAYYTPDTVVESLVRWAVRRGTDRMLDPSCGDGRFLRAWRRSVGVERNQLAAQRARVNAPEAAVHEADFFDWAGRTTERFECAAGNPPFIRYQRFAGLTREKALRLCTSLGVSFSGLTSSWAPFIVATAALLKRGGRLAFVVPAEIGHAPYARPLLGYVVENFSDVRLLAIRSKIFEGLSEDVWLLYADGFGGRTDRLLLCARDGFVGSEGPPERGIDVPTSEWADWNWRLRPFLVSADTRWLYRSLLERDDAVRLGAVAKVGIGYVTGDNDFFHLRPSEAQEARIPKRYLYPSVRSGRSLTKSAITHATVAAWYRRDEPMLLLRLKGDSGIPSAVEQYLDSHGGEKARESYKCRNRTPWYVVPDVNVPDAFLSYMSGTGPSLVANYAGCTCTNSVHAVSLTGLVGVSQLLRSWRSPLTRLSCEIEGHPLGGGMLKLEPREACRVAILLGKLRREDSEVLEEGTTLLRRWRHIG